MISGKAQLDAMFYNYSLTYHEETTKNTHRCDHEMK